MAHPAVYVVTVVGIVATALYAIFCSQPQVQKHNRNNSNNKSTTSDGFQFYATESKCTICFEECTSDIGTLSCGHTFHRACIDKWLKNSDLCPNCMRPTSLI